MKKTILSVFVLILSGITTTLLLTSSSNGRGFAANSGNTGAPGESTTCRSCHGTGFGTTVSIVLKDANGIPVTSYVPGTVYTLDFMVNATGASRYGFQVTSLDASNNPINAFSNPSANTRLVTLGNGRSYAEHAGKSISSSFSTDWTAPAGGTGTVTFYGGGTAANNNGGTSGDGGNTTTLSIAENTTSGIDQISVQKNVSIYPNPAVDYINIDAPADIYSDSRVSLVDKKGNIVFQEEMNLNAIKTRQIAVDSYKRGMYLLRVEGKERTFVTKVVIK